MITCNNNQAYMPNQKVRSLVNRPPSIQVGTEGSVLNRWTGILYAVKMPNGDLYRWLDNQDLFPIDPSYPNLRVGDFAVVQLCHYSHFKHPQLVDGVVVQIIKIIITDYYQIEVPGEGRQGWLTGFEISSFF